MCEGGEHATRLMDKILTQYVEQLNNGKNPDPKEYIAQCPEECRQELTNLIETTKFLKENLIPTGFYKKELIAAHNLVSKIAQARKEGKSPENEKTVVNFRKGALSDDQEKDLKKRLENLWDETFGDDEK